MVMQNMLHKPAILIVPSIYKINNICVSNGCHSDCAWHIADLTFLVNQSFSTSSKGMCGDADHAA